MSRLHIGLLASALFLPLALLWGWLAARFLHLAFFWHVLFGFLLWQVLYWGLVWVARQRRR